MTQTGARRRSAPQAEADGSRGRSARMPLGKGEIGRSRDVLVLALAAGVLLVAGELLPVYTVDVAGMRSCEATALADQAESCAPLGGERHAFALVLLGVFTLAMAWGASAGRSRPAGAALLAIGVLVLVIVLGMDLPHALAGGALGPAYEDANAVPALGLYLQLAGGLLAVIAGALRLRRPS
jgi:hypothetical protein